MTQRNETCHCGSGKKYKHCCMQKDEASARLSKEKRDIAEVVDEKTSPYLFWRRWSGACERCEFGLVYQFLADDGEMKKEYDSPEAFSLSAKRLGLPYSPVWTLRAVKVSETDLSFLVSRDDGFGDENHSVACLSAVKTVNGWRIARIENKTFVRSEHQRLSFALFDIESLAHKHAERADAGWKIPDLADRRARDDKQENTPDTAPLTA